MTVKQFTIPIAVFLIGLAIVIIGALIKILHWQIGPITGNHILTIGSFIELFGVFIALVKLIVIYRKN